MIDTHAHLSGRFGDDLEAVVEEIEKSKLKTVILAAASVEESRENIALAKKYKKLIAAVGIHPQKVDVENKKSVEEQLSQLDELIDKERKWVRAMGETGLDYSEAPGDEENRSKKEQERLFRGQISLAEKYNLPLMVHARKAVDEAIEIAAGYRQARGVFHCYAGGKKRIRKILELGQGWYFGIDGNLTYEMGLEQVVAEIPKQRLVLETDSPFLTPVPHRGKKNKPEYVVYVYKKVAEIWGKSFEETERIVDANAKKLFGL